MKTCSVPLSAKTLLLLLALALPVSAAEGAATLWPPSSFPMAVLSTIIFGLLGILLAVVGFKLFDAMIKANLEQEICEKQNVAVAILCAGVVLGICLIVAAAVHG